MSCEEEDTCMSYKEEDATATILWYDGSVLLQEDFSVFFRQGTFPVPPGSFPDPHMTCMYPPPPLGSLPHPPGSFLLPSR